MNHVDKAQLWGKALKVAPSKHSIVQMPKEGQPVSTPTTPPPGGNILSKLPVLPSTVSI